MFPHYHQQQPLYREHRMKLRENDTLLALRRIQGFLDNYAPALGTIPTSGVRLELDASVVTLTAHAVAQKTSKAKVIGATGKLKELRSDLMQGQMAPIATIAKAKIPGTPELAALQMPSKDIHSQALITAATAMGNTAAPYAATFTGQGLPADFLARLKNAAAALQSAIDGRSAVKTTGVAATTGAKSEVQLARAVIKQINAMVVPLLAGNPTLLSAWKNTKAITSKPGVPLGSTQTITTTVPAAPTTATPAPTATPSTSTPPTA
jgi:hypothetical protein